MKLENINFVLSIIGVVTGVASLLLHFYKFLLEKPRAKVKQDKNSHSYYFKASDFKIEHYKTNYCAVISLKISNCSAYPLTIDSVFAKTYDSKYQSRHNPEFKFCPKEIKISEKFTTCYLPSPPMSLPLRINPFDTVFVSIRLPFFDRFVNENSLKTPITVKLVLSSPRKVYHCKVKLYEYMYYHDLHCSLQQK